MESSPSNHRLGLDQASSWVPSLVYFVDRRCLPSWRISLHEMPYHGLSWVVSGKATYWFDGASVSAGPGDLVYVSPGSQRRAVTDPLDPMHCLVLDFRCHHGEGGEIANLGFSSVTSLGFPPGLRDLYSRLEQVWLEKSHGYPLEVRGLVSLILHRLVTACGTDPQARAQAPRLQLIQRYIVEHYHQPLEVADLAALVQLHPRYFGAWFRQQTGLTVHQYLNRIRIRRAVDLLSTGGFQVGEVADRCGFNDIFYFSKVFRRLTGKPPRDYLRPERQ